MERSSYTVNPDNDTDECKMKAVNKTIPNPVDNSTYCSVNKTKHWTLMKDLKLLIGL